MRESTLISGTGLALLFWMGTIAGLVYGFGAVALMGLACVGTLLIGVAAEMRDREDNEDYEIRVARLRKGEEDNA